MRWEVEPNAFLARLSLRQWQDEFSENVEELCVPVRGLVKLL